MKFKPNNKKYKSTFNRNLLPNPHEYYRQQGLTLTGGGEWKSAICPFHQDKNPSLRLHIDSGGFRCMACGTHGGDVLAFHMQLHKLNFINAAHALGALENLS